jgi:aldehyde:ferredoxin oxidoreductase
MTDYTAGYSGKILLIDLGSRTVSESPVSEYAAGFLGGRGIAARLYWDEVAPGHGPLDADNALIFATGPLTGIPVVGASRLVVCGRSPALNPPCFACANMGGRTGLSLKSAGYDALLIRGSSERPVYLVIGETGVEFRDASTLWSRGAVQTRATLEREAGKDASVAVIGPAGENLVRAATILSENDAVASAGMGAIMGSKKLKAIVIRGGSKKIKVAQPERLKELTSYFTGLGTELMSVVGNMEFRITTPQTRKAPCYGCQGNCLRRSYRTEDGLEGKFMCQPATFYRRQAEAFYGPGLDVPFKAARLCDDWGLDAMSVSMTMLWLYRCLRAGILNDEKAGIPVSKLGSLEFIETLVRKIALREGLGHVMADGVLAAAESVGPASAELIRPLLSKGGQPNITDPRLYVTCEMLHATEPRPPQPQLREISVVVTRWVAWLKGASQEHYLSTDVLRRIARRFWGSEIAADFSTHEGKALAARLIQDREYAKDCLVLCSFLWPVLDIANSDDHAGDPDLESRFLSAVTGREIDEAGLRRIGERAFNLQRAIMVREGHRGREEDLVPESWFSAPLKGDPINPECLVPGRNGEPFSRKGAVLDRAEFEKSRDEYYRLRGWNGALGLPERAVLQDLELGDVAADLIQRGIIPG